jgi:hypothetical protein
MPYHSEREETYLFPGNSTCVHTAFIAHTALTPFGVIRRYLCWTLLAGVLYNRLRVFRIANTAHLGRGVGQERWWRVGPSEKYAVR